LHEVESYLASLFFRKLELWSLQISKPVNGNFTTLVNAYEDFCAAFGVGDELCEDKDSVRCELFEGLARVGHTFTALTNENLFNSVLGNYDSNHFGSNIKFIRQNLTLLESFDLQGLSAAHFEN